MKSLPYSIFKVVQGLCFPNKAEILCLGEWDTADWSCTQTIVDKLTTNTDVVILPVNHSNASTILQKSTHIDYKFHVVIYGHVFEEIEQLCIDFQPEIIEARGSYVGILVHEFGKKSYLVNKIDSGDVIEIDNPTFFVPQFNIENWSQNGNQIIFSAPEIEVEFIVPDDFSLQRTSPDLLWAVEHVLLSPWHDKYNLDWVPTRRPGNFPGLSFSGGVDSTAAMCVMPENTLLFYMERNFKSMIQHENAHRFISHLRSRNREVLVIESNHEKIRTFYDKNPGFSTDYACMAHLILVADYYDLDAAGTGMPLENTYFFHGSKVRDFSKSGFWKRYAPIFSYLGIPIFQPVAGCSEVLNNSIVNQNGFLEFATSCLRSDIEGSTCDSCWKCFRKNTFNNLNWEMSPEISKFLSKRPLKQGIATLYALQQIHNQTGTIPTEAGDLISLMDTNLEFLNYLWGPSLDLLPSKYRAATKDKLSHYASVMEFDLYELDETIINTLRGVSS